MKYVLEPMLFAFDQDMSEQELIDYLSELQALDDWWNRHTEDMLVLDSQATALWDNNYYPIANTLKPLMEKHDVDFIQFGDVNKIINKMLSKSTEIDTLYEGLCGMKNQSLKQPMTVKPGVKRHEELHDELMKLLWHVFLAHEVGDYEEKSFVVITKGISEMVSVEYRYEEMVENGKDIKLEEKTGTSEVNCKCSLDDFLKDTATPYLLWKTAERKDDLDLGVRVAVLQCRGEDCMGSVYQNYDFTIQDSFYSDYCDGHYKSKDQEIRSTIQAVTDTVTGVNPRKSHAIRTGKKGNDPQLVINDYGAQRRDITTSIKLAYWKKGREFKIANMKEHDFFEPSWEQ